MHTNNSFRMLTHDVPQTPLQRPQRRRPILGSAGLHGLRGYVLMLRGRRGKDARGRTAERTRGLGECHHRHKLNKMQHGCSKDMLTFTRQWPSTLYPVM